MAGLRARLLRLLERVGEAGISPGLVGRNLSVSRSTATRLIGDLVAEGAIYRPTPKGKIYAAGVATKVRDHQAQHAAAKAATRTGPGSSSQPPPQASSRARAAPQVPALPLTPGQRADAWIETVRSPAGQYGLMAFGTLSAGLFTKLIAGPEAAREVVTAGMRAAEAVAVLKSVPGDVRPDQVQTMVDRLLAGETIEPYGGPPTAEAAQAQAVSSEVEDQLEARRRGELLLSTVRNTAQQYRGLGLARRELVDLRASGGRPEDQAMVLVSVGYLRWSPGSIPGVTGSLVVGPAWPGPDDGGVRWESEVPLIVEGLIARMDQALDQSRRQLVEGLRTALQLGMPPEVVLGPHWSSFGIRRAELRPPALEPGA